MSIGHETERSIHGLLAFYSSLNVRDKNISFNGKYDYEKGVLIMGNKIKDTFKKLVIKFGLRRAKRKSSILKSVIDNPESIKLEAYIEGDEIIVRLKRRDD